jgi:hypothetical protein
VPGKKLFVVLFLCALLFQLAPWVYCAFYAHPIADDYCYANLSQHNSFFSEYCKQYFTWNGRYSSNLLVLLNPLLTGSLLNYQIIPVILILLTVAGFYGFLKAIVSRQLNNIYCWCISLGLTCLYLFEMPSPAEGFYWYTGAITYQLANCIALFYLALLIQYYFRKYLFKQWLHALLLVLLLILLIGFNETILLMFLSLHTALFLGGIITRNFAVGFKKLTTLLFAIALVASLVVILAPGNGFRAALFPGNHQLVHSILFSLMQTSRFVLDWVSNLPLLFVSVLRVY